MGGIVAAGFIFSKPIIDTILPTPLFAAYEPPPTPGDGCTPGFWKNHDQSFWPNDPIDPVTITKEGTGATKLNDAVAFSFPAVSNVTTALAGKTFLEALMFGGGDSLVEKTQIMLRAAAAAYLNAAKFGGPPPLGQFGISLADVILTVNDLLSQTAIPVGDPAEAQLKMDMTVQGLIFDDANNSGECDFLLDGG